MIVSRRHRFVFAAVPKTGTHAVRQALRNAPGELLVVRPDAAALHPAAA